MAYCRWLGEVTGKAISLPSEAERDKAARGAQDTRAYPRGDAFDGARCNTDKVVRVDPFRTV
jgi:formylglycine-generating enzyme required for sulfatase activity